MPRRTRRRQRRPPAPLGWSSKSDLKMLEALHELMPKAARIAVLVNPTNQNAAADTKEAEAAARTLGLEFQVRSENVGGAARADAKSRTNCRAGEPDQSKCRGGHEGGRGGRPHPWAGVPSQI